MSRPWKQKAPSGSVQEWKYRSAWIFLVVARGSFPAEVARDRRHRSCTAVRGASAAPASSSSSREGSSTPAPHSSVSLGAESVPRRSSSAVPGSWSSRRPLVRVPRAWPAETPSTEASREAASRWPPSRQIPLASTRGASTVLPATESRSSPAKEP